MKVLCDQMLGSLARWLRFIGIDTFFSTEKLSDSDLLKIAQHDDRVLITRDKQLVTRAQKRQQKTIFLESVSVSDQLKKVLLSIPLDQQTVFSRCSVCNTQLTQVKKPLVKNHVPARVFSSHETFWFCSTCNKYYWHGTHTDAIKKTLSELGIET